MQHIAEQQHSWNHEDSLSVAEAIKDAMENPQRTAPRRAQPNIEFPRDLSAPEPHLPLRKASGRRLQSRKGSVPKPLFNPTQNHQLRGFSPSPVGPPVPHIENIQASSEHAWAGRERRPLKAMGVLENQQPMLQYAEMRSPAWSELENNRPPSSPLLPPSVSQELPRLGTGLRNSKSVGDELRNLRHRVSSKQKHGDSNGRLTPDTASFTTRPSTHGVDEVRDSCPSALTSHSSFGHTSSLNTTHTSLTRASTSSCAESFVQVRKEDWDEGGLTDMDMSVEDAIGMYEAGFESGTASAKQSLDVRSVRSAEAGGRFTPEVGGRQTPEVRSIRSLHMERPASQPPMQPQSLPKQMSQPATPTKLRPNASHRRSQSASILILGVPRAARPSASPSPGPSLFAPTYPGNARTSVQIVSNERSRPVTAALDAVPRDRYGFKKVTQYITVEQYDAWNAGYSQHIERRSRKWHTLMRSYGLSTKSPLRFPPKSDKIKRYIRKGIPPEFRGAAWFWYAGGPGKLAKDPGQYWELVEKCEKGGHLTDNDREHIERDLNRTFPDNVRFKPDPTSMSDVQAGAGGGQSHDSRDPPNAHDKKRMTKDPETPILKALRRVLQAFAVHRPDIGYCQSLNFIAGLLLLFLDEDEEKSFVLLDIVTREHLPGTHGVALEGANVDIAVLMSCIKDSQPAVWNKLDDKGGMGVGGLASSVGAVGALRLPTVSLATTAWFMSLFVGTLPIESVLRVWDCLWFEGSKALFRTALSIFKYAEAPILQVQDPMEIFQLVQTIPRSMLDINALMEVCFKRRGGFGGVSQGLIETRRAERRRMVKEGVSDATTDEGALRKLRGRLRRGTVKVQS